MTIFGTTPRHAVAEALGHTVAKIRWNTVAEAFQTRRWTSPKRPDGASAPPLLADRKDWGVRS